MNKEKKEKLAEYLHLYLKSGISVYIFADNSLSADSINDGFLHEYVKNNPNGVYNPVLTTENYERFLRDGYKPILRPDTDMTSEESQEMQLLQEGKGITQAWAFMTKWLIEKGFDVFGLIELGLAIDKTKIDAIVNKAKAA